MFYLFLMLLTALKGIGPGTAFVVALIYYMFFDD